MTSAWIAIVLATITGMVLIESANNRRARSRDEDAAKVPMSWGVVTLLVPCVILACLGPGHSRRASLEHVFQLVGLLLLAGGTYQFRFTLHGFPRFYLYVGAAMGLVGLTCIIAPLVQ